MPRTRWEDLPLTVFLKAHALSDPDRYHSYRISDAPPFFFSPNDLPIYATILTRCDSGGTSAADKADRLAQGWLTFFGKIDKKVGAPPDWHRNAFSGLRAPEDVHWSRIPDFGFGDIKVIWEPSRFGFVFDLVRAYWRTGEERYAEAFWLLVEDWRERNPPNCGANWKCGQEISFRIMAWCFGLYGFMGAAATRADRVARLAQMIAVSAERIEGNIGYALSQKNNHGISEAVGLWTVGLLFPELRHAKRWKEKGRRFLEEQGRSLIYADGSFSQHSFNYHRLMLHDYLWALRLGDLNGEILSDGLKERVKKAADFLYQVQDDQTGQVPCYGQNDGALILPLSNCDYRDFRPVIQAVHYYFSGECLFDNGPWDEDLLWLFGPEALSAPVKTRPKQDLQARDGGYYTFRNDTGFTLVRCAAFKARPGQADMLHVDLWWRGQNIAVDPGTYSYNAPDPWNNPLAHSAYHNTITVDGRDQMDRVGKFLWLPWVNGKVRCMKRSSKGDMAYWEGGHDGYQRLVSPVIHRRGILQLAAGTWLVMDCLIGTTVHAYRLHWLFPDLEHSWDKAQGLFTLMTSSGPYYIRMKGLDREGLYSLVRADEQSARGWRAPCYSCREAALSLDLTVKAADGLFWTLFSPDVCGVEREESHLLVTGASWEARIAMGRTQESPLITDVSLTGLRNDRLEIH